MKAAGDGDVLRIKALLADGAPLEARDEDGNTPLLRATLGNHEVAASVLMKAGADVNAKNRIEDSAYLYAGARGYNEILTLTLRHGADIRSTNRYGGTALIPACERGLAGNRAPAAARRGQSQSRQQAGLDRAAGGHHPG